MSQLLSNAMDSIRVGVADYESHDRPRLLSAVRGLHAGILLLYKEALRRLSPDGSNEVLLMNRILPEVRDGEVTFIGQGRKTATTHQIRERFDALGIKTDWSRFKRVASVRNDIEHYFSTATEDGVRGLIADAFVLIRDFMTVELDEDPAAALGWRAWETMLSMSEVVERERADCAAALDAVDWGSAVLKKAVKELPCCECGALLLMPSGEEPELRCRSCGEEESRDSYATRAVREHLSFDDYLAIKEGGELPYVLCPTCGCEAYVVSEQRCANCGESCAHECIRCGLDIPAEELSGSSLCGWCAHMSTKD